MGGSRGRDPRGEGDRVLPYFHINVGSDHFLGFKILNLNIFWVFHQNE